MSVSRTAEMSSDKSGNCTGLSFSREHKRVRIISSLLPIHIMGLSLFAVTKLLVLHYAIRKIAVKISMIVFLT